MPKFHSLTFRARFAAGLFMGIASAGLLCAQAPGSNAFLVHNLVSDLPGIADHQDPKLVNPWGSGFGSTPFWIGDNGSGSSTLYDGYGTASALVVSIPAAGGANSGGPVTGVLFNSFSSNTAAFNVAAGKAASFIFCSEDGIISGWNSSADATHALVMVDNSKSGAVYKGCALGGTAAAPLLFAANFNSGAVDVFDAKLAPVAKSQTAFVNPMAPSGFAPFNTQVINGNVYVTWAKQDANKHDDVAGAGNGYVAIFDTSGNLLESLAAQGALNSPWGMAVAPASFGPFGGALLVGNFGDGKINAFGMPGGELLGTLDDQKSNPISIPGLWSLNFGSGARNEDAGTLYFTAGIGGGPNNDPVESHGLLGSIQPAASLTSAGVVSAASLSAGPIAANEWVSIFGSAFSPVTATWQVTGSQLPTQVGGVTVTVNGEAAPLSFVGNAQINLLVPADIQPGPAQIQIKENGFTSAVVNVTAQPMAPAFFIIGTNATTAARYIAATHADGTLVGPSSIKGATAAKPGETVALYGAGFGPASSTIPNGQAISSPLTLPVNPLITIDGMVAQVTYAGLTATGLYQINVTIPSTIQTGADDLVVALIGNTESQANAFLTIAAQ